MERVTGIEPAFSAWEADVLPLNYTREVLGEPSKRPRRRLPARMPRSAPVAGVASRPARQRGGRTMDRRKLGAEVLGTFWLVLGGCGTAVLAASEPGVGTPRGQPRLRAHGAHGRVRPRPRLRGALQPGHHAGAGRRQAVPGRRRARLHRRPGHRRLLAAASVLFAIASGIDSFDVAGRASRPTASTTCRRVATTSLACFVCEVVMTAVFLLVIMGATRKGAPPAPRRWRSAWPSR